MDKNQLRYDKHIKDKRKSKVKSVKCPRPVQTNTNLASNWDRYENEECASSKSELDSSTDFSILANAPITQGYHFQFKTDKFNEAEVENTKPNELFSLDLNMLKHSILTVPFHQRMGIDESYFGENQLNFMKKDAEENYITYNLKYNTETRQEESKPKNKSQGLDEFFDKIKVTEENNFEEKSEDSLQLVPHINNANNLQNIKEDADDLEQWLENILDD